ncbi:MAG: oxidoreductase [Gemmatimonadota bacterium]
MNGVTLRAGATLGATLLLFGCRSPEPIRPRIERGPPPPVGPTLTTQSSGTDVLLQAISPVSDDVVWVSGHGATYAFTTDGGTTWTANTVPGVGGLQFRDVHAFDARTAVLMSAGSGDQSRMYRTEDAGDTWSLRWTNEEPDGFYDCVDFWDRERGVAYGDAVGGQLRILRTSDGGRTWRRLDGATLPPARDGEGGFAASGTCVLTRPGGLGWIATGNASGARVLRTADYGETWTAHDVPVVSGQGAGLTSVAMIDDLVGVAFGGDLAVADAHTDNVARTVDGGLSWSLGAQPAMVGAIYGGAHVPGTTGSLVVVGPGGADLSFDGGATWEPLDSSAWWGVAASGSDAIWVAGPDGRIARISIP